MMNATPSRDGTSRLMGRVALGTAGLVFGADRSRRADLATLRAGIDAGVSILDTARAYARTDDTFYGETLTAEAATGRSVIIGTKGGHSLIGPREWDADISEARLRSDVDGSLGVFGVERLPLYYLHRVDLAPQPVVEGVSALAALRDEGKIERIGLSNVTVEELEEAVAVTTIDAVQNPHGALSRQSADTLQWCERHGVPFFAYSPLRRLSDPATSSLAAAAAGRGVSVQRLLLRALLASSPVLSVVSGATRVETVLDSVAAEREPWDEELDAAYQEDLRRHRDTESGAGRPAERGAGA
jgi:pyridoxine 4-dehydrogenase